MWKCLLAGMFPKHKILVAGIVLKVNPSQPNILPSKRKGLLYKKGSSVTVLEN